MNYEFDELVQSLHRKPPRWKWLAQVVENHMALDHRDQAYRIIDTIMGLLLVIALIFFVGVFSGCAVTGQATTRTVPFNKELLRDCDQLPKLTDSSDEAILDHQKQVYKGYNECATMKRKLNIEVKKALNIKE